MVKEQALVETTTKSHYGLWDIYGKDTTWGYVISHSGGWPGYTTHLSRNVDKDQTFIVLSKQ